MVAIGVFIEGRDMGSVVSDMQDRVAQRVKLPAGYTMSWSGEFENQERAMSRLAVIVPISILLIFLLLFDAFKSFRGALLIVLNIPFAMIGGIVALLVTGIPLSVSAAIGFIALGLWAGRRLTPRARAAEFRRNDAAIRSLGLTPRECEILALLASGQSNKEMARTLAISPNTIKTHVARVYEKLEVARRVQAIEKARWLSLIP